MTLHDSDDSFFYEDIVSGLLQFKTMRWVTRVPGATELLEPRILREKDFASFECS